MTLLKNLTIKQKLKKTLALEPMQAVTEEDLSTKTELPMLKKKE